MSLEICLILFSIIGRVKQGLLSLLTMLLTGFFKLEWDGTLGISASIFSEDGLPNVEDWRLNLVYFNELVEAAVLVLFRASSIIGSSEGRDSAVFL